MQDTLRSIKAKIAAGDRGFTLIELLVVVVIIGVLVAISIPVYLNYREGAANKAAQSDVRAAISAVEQFYTDNASRYPGDESSTGPGASMTLELTGGGGTTQRVNLSEGTELVYNWISDTHYRICAKNTGGPAVYLYDNETGGAVKKSSRSSIADCQTNGD